MTRVLSLAVVMGMVIGCAATKQAKEVVPAGFLQDLYPHMRPGKGDEALLVYRNPTVDWAEKATYTKILLDPVMIWRGEDSVAAGPTQQDVQDLANAFYAVLYQELSKDYEMVSDPGPKTFRMQAALTNAQRSRPALDILSSVPAPMNVVFMASTFKTWKTGKPLFKGEASVEGKVIDAASGDVIAAAVDRRVGGRFLNGDVFDSLNDVYGALKYWSQLTRFRLCQLRKQSTCVPPEP